MLSEDLQIYRDTYELCRLMYAYMKDVEKSARYGEYGRAVSMALEALDQIYVANIDRQGRTAEQSVRRRVLQRRPDGDGERDAGLPRRQRQRA